MVNNLSLDFYQRLKKIHEVIYADDLGGSPFNKCFLMANLFRNLNYENYVEIGVYRGKSLFTVSVAVQACKGRSYGIDPYSESCFLELDAAPRVQQIIEKSIKEVNFDELFQEVLRFKKDFGFDSTVNLLREPSNSAVHYFRDHDILIDMLHIDGNHDKGFVHSDASNYIPLVKDGGIIIFDDIDWPSVRSVYEGEKLKYITLYETDTFGILVKLSKSSFREEQLHKYNSVLEETLKDFPKITNLLDPLDLLIIDDIFPYPISGFRLEEYTQYLKEIERIRIYCNGGSLHVISKEKNHDVIHAFKQDYPQYAEKVIPWRSYNLCDSVQAKLAYFCFLGNTYCSLDTIENNKIPFVFELYPGGAFALHRPESDQLLRRVTSSRFFRKVIVTQKLSHDYLIDNGFCSEDQIVTIFGVVTSTEKINKSFGVKRHFGVDKDRLDICFAAMKYTPHGEDKGYDVFIEAAKKLCSKYQNVFFHVVGDFDKGVLDVSEIADRITFYGIQTQDWFDEFYMDKDIIISPNIHGKIFKGAFDGFPTGCCIDAGLRDTAIFCTDELGQNDGIFVDGSEIVIIEHNAEDVVQKIEHYYHHPDELCNLSIRGRMKVKQLYSWDAQIKPRLDLLKQEIDNYLQNMWYAMNHANNDFAPQFHWDAKPLLLNTKKLSGFKNSQQDLAIAYTDLVGKYQVLEDYTRKLQKAYISIEADHGKLRSDYQDKKNESKYIVLIKRVIRKLRQWRIKT